MKSTLVLTSFLALSSVAAAFQTQGATLPKVEAATPEIKAIGAELTEMMRLDQLHRSAVQWGTTDPEELARLDALDHDATMKEWARRAREGISLAPEVEKDLMEKQNKIDKANVLRLGEMIEAHGYPDPERFDLTFPDPVPILIHAQLEDYRPLEPLLLKEARAGRMDPKSFAVIYDRKQQHAGKMQLYGTGFALDVKTGKTLPPEVADIDATNKARKAIGLEPLTEFRIAPKKAHKNAD